MSADSPESESKPDEYLVVARRYRPQSFSELIGQQQVTQALENAIVTNRVGHAYLFTGARGVGKTSAARILSKALNCQQGPTPTPCNACDVCISVALGEDVDVLEIDGASNRGIDEIRQLRANVGVRPSRSRFKVYIIDEVHMLTKEAFNALLKTLEEPPDHVKFIFCTTDPEKIPITVLSRCQRFDFAPVDSGNIVARLEEIVKAEGGSAEREALEMLARRAAGSMRDSQSLLEQLLSFSGDTITAKDVHNMFGTAQSGRVFGLVQHLISRDCAAALAELEAASSEGVDVGQLAEQLIGHIRDMMATSVGCDADLLMHCNASDQPALAAAAQQWGLATMLAAAQILDQAIARMRQSVHRRVLVEMALIRIGHLPNLDSLSDAVARLEGHAPPANTGAASQSRKSASAVKKKPVNTRIETAHSATTRSPAVMSADMNIATTEIVESSAVATAPLTVAEATDTWRKMAATLDGVLADAARTMQKVEVTGANSLAVSLNNKYNATYCERPEHKSLLEKKMKEFVGQTIRLQFRTGQKKAIPQNAPAKPQVSPAQLMRQIHDHPFVQKAVQLFDAELTRVHPKK